MRRGAFYNTNGGGKCPLKGVTPQIWIFPRKWWECWTGQHQGIRPQRRVKR